MSKSIHIFGFHSIESLLKTNPESVLKVLIQNSRKDKRISTLTNTLSKSREGNGRPQLRRPEKQFGAKYSKRFASNNYIGPFSLNYDYRHVGKTEDWIGSIRKDADSTDIMNLSLSKELFGYNWSLSITNLTDEYYQRPHGFQQEGRRISLSFRSKY